MKFSRLPTGTALAAVPFFFAACSAPGTLVYPPPPGEVQVHVGLKQGGIFDCGPEVLAAILEINGKPADVDAISSEICEKTKGGTSPLMIAAYAARVGLQTLAAPGCPWETLRAALASGIPAITMVRIGPLTFHYYLVVGAPPGRVICADYGGAVREFTEEEFAGIWNLTHRFTLFVARDVSGIPYDELEYLRKLTEPPFPRDFMTGAGHAAWGAEYEGKGLILLAKIEYRRAIDMDSRQVRAALALGNLYAAEQDWKNAADAFRKGSHAGGSCANNLAYVLSEHLDDPERAWPFAQDAEKQSLPKSNPWFESFDTQGTVALRLGKNAEAEAAWRRGAEAAGEDRRAYRAACWAGAARAAMRQQAEGVRRAGDYLERAKKDGLSPEEIRSIEQELQKN